MPIDLKLKKKDSQKKEPKKKESKKKEPKNAGDKKTDSKNKIKLNIKMPTVKLTKRDKYMLAALFALGLIYAAWNFAALPLLTQVDELKAELDTVNQEVLTAQLDLAGLDKRREELAELKKIHAEEGQGYFHDFVQENVIVELSKKIRASGIVEGSVSYQQPENGAADAAISSLVAGSTTISLNFTGDYGQLMAFLAEIENDPKTMLVETLSLSGNDNGEVSGSMVLNIPIFNSPYMNQDPAYEFDWDSIEQGKLTPFDSTGIKQLPDIPEIDISALPEFDGLEGEAVTDIASITEPMPSPAPIPPEPPSEQPQVQEMPEDITDFFLSAMADTADYDAAMFGKTGDTTGESYVSADKNSFVNVLLVFDQNSEGKYFYRAEIDGNSSGAVAFVPRSSDINIKIFSMSRYSMTDFAGMRLHVENKTDSELNIQVISDDTESPRVFFTYKSGKVNVENVR